MRKCLTLKLMLALTFLLCSQVFANNRKAVVLVDMQSGYYPSKNSEDYPKMDVLFKNQQKLLKWAVGNDIPIIVFEYKGYGITEPALQKIYSQGTSHTFIKDTTDGFSNVPGASPGAEKAEQLLRNWGVETIIIAGINGTNCVASTAWGAVILDFNVITTGALVADLYSLSVTYPSLSWFEGGSWSALQNSGKLTFLPNLESIFSY